MLPERRDRWARAALSVAPGVLYAAALLWAEGRYPLRERVEPGVTRVGRNVAMMAMAALTVAAVENPIVQPLAALCERRRIGLTGMLPPPRIQRAAGGIWRDVLAIVLMDYSLYLWHVLTHRSDFLYRFHQVHHADLDLDVSTAARFHFGEMLVSVPWRAAQVLVVGTSRRALRIWQRVTLASILFHHSNIRLPRRLERMLGYFVATPRLHGIHHSTAIHEQNSNWSNGLTLWDRLHRTFRDDRSQTDIEIGVPRYRTQSQVTLGKLLSMPRISSIEARSGEGASGTSNGARVR